MKRRITLLVAGLISVSALSARAEIEGFRIALTPYAGTTLWTEEYQLQNKALFGGRLGLFPIPWVGVEGTVGYSSTNTSFEPNYQTDMLHYGIDVVANILPRKMFNPYVLAGWTQLTYESSEDNTATGSTRYIDTGFEAGAGLNTRLVDASGFRMDLRLEARAAVTKLQPWFPNYDEYHPNWLFTGGLQFAFGGKEKDTDKDGVKDRDDDCPGTPLGAVVNARGCAVDSDGDGVPDGIDQCDDTPQGAAVDASGCPLDSDGDGVFDGLDVCDDTPAGATVDQRGCPIDSDGDGVFDGLDQCPDTPERAVVDSVGCPVDGDGDGVPNGIDVCPQTPPHLEVDENGCPIETTQFVTEILDTGKIRSSDIRFALNSADIDPASHHVLDEIGLTLVQWKVLRIEIGGYTDSSGRAEYNRELSQRRAESVRTYLLQKHPEIDASQFTAVGYGEADPVASNDTKEGQALNRRVEFKVLNSQALEREILQSGYKVKDPSRRP